MLNPPTFNDGREKLLRFGISPALFEPLLLSEEAYETLYRRLRSMNSAYSTSVVINASWQLQILTGTQQLDLLNAGLRDDNNTNIAHYLAFSAQRKGLDWVRNHHPALLTAKNDCGWNIAHFAALSGCVEVLEWVKNHCSALFTKKTKKDRNIAHYAAWSGLPDALEWVKSWYPSLLTQPDKYGNMITDFAIGSESPECANKAIALSKTPSSFSFRPYSRAFDRTYWNLVLSALENNFTLLEVKTPQGMDAEIKRKIVEIVARNKQFHSARVEFLTFVEGCYQQNCEIAALSVEMLSAIFKNSVPEGVPEAFVNAMFEEILLQASPVYRAETMSKKIIELIEKDISAEKGKTHLLSQLRYRMQQVEVKPAAVTREFIQFYQENAQEINFQSNKVHKFFIPNHKTDTRKLCDEIGKLFDLDLSKEGILINKNKYQASSGDCSLRLE